MQGYVRRRQVKIAEYIATCPIFEMCIGSESIPGYSWCLMWWEQGNILEGGNVTNKGEGGKVE